MADFRPNRLVFALLPWLVTLVVTTTAGAQKPRTEIFQRIARRPEFNTVRTDTVVFLSDLDRDVARAAVIEIDATRQHVFALLKRIHVEQTPQRIRALRVVGFSEASDFHAAATEIRKDLVASAGFYDRKSGVTFFHIPTSTDASDPIVDQAWKLVLRHETVHQVLDLHAPTLTTRLPWWVSEGLACCFESGSNDDTFNQWRAMDLCPSNGSVTTAPQFVDTVNNLWLATTNTNPTAHDYAVAWAFAHHLVRNHPGMFGKFLRDIQSAPAWDDHRILFERSVFTFDKTRAVRILNEVHRLACPTSASE